MRYMAIVLMLLSFVSVVNADTMYFSVFDYQNIGAPAEAVYTSTGWIPLELAFDEAQGFNTAGTNDALIYNGNIGVQISGQKYDLPISTLTWGCTLEYVPAEVDGRFIDNLGNTINWGLYSNFRAGGVQVPEPVTVAVLMAGVPFLMYRRRRLHRH